MQKNNNILSDNLNDEQKRTLNILLNMIIPPSEDGKMPGAADVGFFAYMNNENIVLWIQEGLISVSDESHNKYDKEFSALNSLEQTQLIDILRRKLFKFFNHLTLHVIQCYYQYDQVIEGIGLEARPPFPQGYHLEEGDLTLLEPVYMRGKIYRE